MNYWENPEFTREQLIESIISLVEFVEGTNLDESYFEEFSEEWLREQVEWLEYLADK